ncbi:hypothetical protein [Breoghania sp.]|uniref:hypothetical protein n=1 Tax=Breoghania sp. TaxID=2065378 RepID=UPI002620891A|nr:hypothetical protein [Breoghania sp.]MDJ0931921.1 hypothetical protein [Breoghania sp.]
MQTGDFIFSAIGREDNAISAVTEGFHGARLNHMGVIEVAPRGVFVLESLLSGSPSASPLSTSSPAAPSTRPGNRG